MFLFGLLMTLQGFSKHLPASTVRERRRAQACQRKILEAW